MLPFTQVSSISLKNILFPTDFSDASRPGAVSGTDGANLGFHRDPALRAIRVARALFIARRESW